MYEVQQLDDNEQPNKLSCEDHFTENYTVKKLNQPFPWTSDFLGPFLWPQIKSQIYRVLSALSYSFLPSHNWDNKDKD